MTDEKNIKIEEEEHGSDSLSQLLDSSYPLLKKFRDACPGTYKHTQALASMIEGVSLALGLDVTFMKVAAFYHDVGKMNNAKYFTENQLEEEDPHKKIDPWISFQIISRHVADTVNVLINDKNFPRKLIEIISQHHGNSVVKYFFKKSKTDVEDLYRYRCTKATCVESAVLMICDSIEATSRSLVQSGKYKNPAKLVESIINELLDDEQLDEVTMRLGDLKQLKIALGKELEGMYSKRIDYDEAEDEVEKDETKK